MMHGARTSFKVSKAAGLFSDVSMTHAFGSCSSGEFKHAMALQGTSLLRHSTRFEQEFPTYVHEQLLHV